MSLTKPSTECLKKRSYLPSLKTNNCFLREDSEPDSFDDSDENVSDEETATHHEISINIGNSDGNHSSSESPAVSDVVQPMDTSPVEHQIERFTPANLEDSDLFTKVEVDDLSDASKASKFLVKDLQYVCTEVNFPDEDEELFRKDLEGSFYNCHPFYEMGKYSSGLNDITFDKYTTARKDGIKKYGFQHLLNCPNPLHFGCGTKSDVCYEDLEPEKDLESDNDSENIEDLGSEDNLFQELNLDLILKKAKS